MLRRSLEKIQEHAYEDINVQQWLIDYEIGTPVKIEYIGWAKLRTNEKGEFKHKNQAYFFTYYKMTLNDSTYYLNCMAHQKLKHEDVYSIEKKEPNDLIGGLPPEPPQK